MENNNLTAADYAEQWTEAMSLLINNALESVSFDRTLEAIIINQDKEDENRYLVETDDLRFYARSMDETKKYATNNKVYILVPDGDWEREKIIQGPVLSSASQKLRALMANSLANMVPVKSFNFVPNYEVAADFKYHAPYDHMGVEVRFKDGDTSICGFAIKLQVQFFNSVQWSEPVTIFTNDNIIGNIQTRNANIPYFKLTSMFEGFSDLTSINKIKLSIEYAEEENQVEFEKIIVYFGYSKEKILNNPLQVYDKYKNFTYQEQRQENTMYIEFYNEPNNTLYSTYNLPPSDLVSGLTGIFPFAYSRGWASDQGVYQYMEPYWALYPALGTSIGETAEKYQQKYEILRKAERNNMTYSTMHNYKASSSQYKFVYIDTNGVMAEASLIYTKDNNTNVEGTNPPNEELLLTLDDGDLGVYNCYGMDGKIYSSSEATKIRTIVATLKSGERLTAENGITKIEWIYPTFTPALHKFDTKSINTPTKPRSGILVANQIATEDDLEHGLYKQGNYIIYQTTNDQINYYNNYIPMGYNIETETWGDTFYYQINTQVDESYTQNTVKCRATTIDGQVYVGAINFEFGGYGNMGTSYSLNLDIEGPKKYITPNSSNLLKLKATFERIDGEPIDVEPEFLWSWYETPVIDPSDKTKVYSALEYYDLSTDEHVHLISRALRFNDAGVISGISLQPATNANAEQVYHKNSIYVKYAPPEDVEFSTLTPYYYEIAQVSVKYKVDSGNTVEFKAYLPIPLCCIEDETDEAFSLQGANRVVYDMFNNITYDKSAYKLLCGYNEYTNNQTIKWAISCDTYYSVCGQDTGRGSELLYPSMLTATHNLKFQDEKVNLVPMSSIQVNSVPNIPSVIAYEPNTRASSALEQYKTGKILWIQPIVTLHNNWNIEAINAWMGKGVDTSENHVLAPLIAAGKKNSGTNSFTGVMLGEVDKWGIFGYQNGKSRFYFTEDGEAYIGNPDQNYYFMLNNKGELKLQLNEFNLSTDTVWINSSEEYGGDYLTDFSLHFGADDKILKETWKLKNPKPKYFGGEGISLLDNKGNIQVRLGHIIKSEWDVSETAIWKKDIYGLDIYSGAIRIYATAYKPGEPNKAKERILWTDTVDGKAELHLRGNIQADSGTIGGIEISSNGLSTTNERFSVSPSGAVIAKDLQLASESSGKYGVWYRRISSIGYDRLNFLYFGFLSDNIGATAYSYPSICFGKPSGSEYSGVINLFGNVNYWGSTTNKQPGTSDIRYKTNINNLIDKYEILFDGLRAVTFQYNNGTSQRYHTGFIAQEVEEGLEKAELTTQDFAGFVITCPGTDAETYGLRYEEFIPINTWQIQKLKARVAELESEIKEIKNEINK